MRRIGPEVLHRLLSLQVDAHDLGGAGVVGHLVVDGDGEGVAEALHLVLGCLAPVGVGQRAEEDLGRLGAANPVQLVALHVQRQT